MNIKARISAGLGAVDRESLLRRLSAADFAVMELALYLDTHPDDRAALAAYKSAVQKAETLTAEFEEKYGAVDMGRAATDTHWTWVDSPWPWEN